MALSFDILNLRKFLGHRKKEMLSTPQYDETEGKRRKNGRGREEFIPLTVLFAILKFNWTNYFFKIYDKLKEELEQF